MEIRGGRLLCEQGRGVEVLTDAGICAPTTTPDLPSLWTVAAAAAAAAAAAKKL